MNLFYLYAEGVDRRMISIPGNRSSEQTYAMIGMDVASNYGHHADADFLHRPKAAFWERTGNTCLNILWNSLGGIGGDWLKPLLLRRSIKKADMLITTSDRVGIPLLIEMYLGLIPRRPIVYISIGLPERWAKMTPNMQRWIRRCFASCVSRVVCYGFEEHEELTHVLANDPETIHFIPFGVDPVQFSPRPRQAKTDFSILSFGADPQRDFDVLIRIAPQLEQNIRIITTTQRKRDLEQRWPHLPKNVTIQTDVLFASLPEYIQSAELVVFPLHPNSYSGATTSLLQCMAMGKPVVVSKTGAIAQGYHFIHQQNVVFATPENPESLLKQIHSCLDDPKHAQQIGNAARETIIHSLTWNHFTSNLFEVIARVNKDL